MSNRQGHTAIKVIPLFAYNPEKADRGLKAMADILAEALHKKRSVTSGRPGTTEP